MAWDDGNFCGEEIFYGDKPADEFAVCLKKISIAYLDAFGRKPTIAEALYSFKIVIGSTPNEYFSDPESIKRVQLTLEEK